MPNKITFDEAVADPSPQARGPITFQEAEDALTAQTRLAVPGEPRVAGEELIKGQGLPGAPTYRPPMFAPTPLPADAANFSTALKANLIEDEDTKLRVIADSLFPGDPNGRARVGLRNGKPVYVNDDGQLQYVSGTMSRGAAGLVANAPEMIIGGVGSLAGSPVIGGAAGATGARGLKRAVTGLVFDEPQTYEGNAIDLAKEAAGSVLGDAVGKYGARWLDRTKVVDFTPAQITKAEQARALIEQKTGVRLDLAQASGDRRLLALRDYAARFPGETAELIQAQDDLQTGQFSNAVNRVMDVVARAKPADVSGRQAINAARLTMQMAQRDVQKTVKPLYDEAYAAKTEITNKRMQALVDVLDRETSAIKDARGLLNIERRKFTPKDEMPLSLELLDLAKRNLDDEVEDLTAKGKANEARVIAEARDEMTAFLDNITRKDIRTADPLAAAQTISLYKRARATYAQQYEQHIKPLEESPLGVLARMQTQHAAVAARVFNDASVTPEQIAVLKAGLQKSNPEAYNGLVRQWMAHEWNEAQQISQGGSAVNPAGKFLQAMSRTPDQQNKVTAMLPKGAPEVLNDVLMAAEALARTPLGAARVSGSNTARDLQITEMLKGRALATLRWLLYPRQSFRDAAEQRVLESGVTSLTEALLDPAKRNQLKQITRMKPSTQQAIQLAGFLGEQTIKTAVEDEGGSTMPAALQPPLQ